MRRQKWVSPGLFSPHTHTHATLEKMLFTQGQGEWQPNRVYVFFAVRIVLIYMCGKSLSTLSLLRERISVGGYIYYIRPRSPKP